MKDLMQQFPSMKQSRDNTNLLEYIFTSGSQFATLQVEFPSNFPRSAPQLKVFGAIQHPWLDLNKRVTGHPSIVSWKPTNNVGQLVQEVVNAFSASNQSSTYTLTSNTPSSTPNPMMRSNTGQPGLLDMRGTNPHLTSYPSMNISGPRPTTTTIAPTRGTMPHQMSMGGPTSLSNNPNSHSIGTTYTVGQTVPLSSQSTNVNPISSSNNRRTGYTPHPNHTGMTHTVHIVKPNSTPVTSYPQPFQLRNNTTTTTTTTATTMGQNPPPPSYQTSMSTPQLNTSHHPMTSNHHPPTSNSSSFNHHPTPPSLTKAVSETTHTPLPPIPDHFEVWLLSILM